MYLQYPLLVAKFMVMGNGPEQVTGRWLPLSQDCAYISMQLKYLVMK